MAPRGYERERVVPRGYERERVAPRRGHLPRLAPEYYRGHATVHWTPAIDKRATGWLTPAFFLIRESTQRYSGHRQKTL